MDVLIDFQDIIVYLQCTTNNKTDSAKSTWKYNTVLRCPTQNQKK